MRSSRSPPTTRGPRACTVTVEERILSNWWRVLLTTVGVYAGGTILRVDMEARGRLTSFAP
jgi:hypothetical protein